MKSLKIVAFILGSALLFEACNPVKTRIPPLNERKAHAVSQKDSHPKSDRRRAQRNKSSPPEDPEFRRLIERARRWKEEQKKRPIHPVVSPIGPGEIAESEPPWSDSKAGLAHL